MSVILKSGSSSNLVNIDSAGNLYVVSTPAASFNTAAALTSASSVGATIPLMTVGGYASILVQLNQTSTITGGTITFEITVDDIDWTVASVLDPNNNYLPISLPYSFQPSVNKQFLVVTNGAAQVRARLVSALIGTGSVTPYWNLLSRNPAADASAGVVTVSNFPATQPVSGTVTANQGTSPWIVSLTSTTVTGTVAVTQSTSPWVVSNGGTFATQITAAIPAGANVIGHVITDTGSTTAVTGTVTVAGTVAFSNTTIAVTNTGTFAVQAAQSGTWNVGTVATITNPVTVVGDAASGTTAAGNPVLTGGVFNTTQPTVTNGQAVSNQATARGAQIVATGVDAFNVALASTTITGTVAVTQSTSPWVVSLTSTTITGTVAVTQSGTWNIGTVTAVTAITNALPAGTNVIGHVITDTGSTTAVTGTVTVSGTVTANIGTTGGITVAQASTTAGQSGPLVQGAVTTAAPTYTTAQTSPLSLDTTGNLRTSVNNTVTVAGTVAFSNTTIAVTNTGTFAVQATQSGTWNVGTLTSITNAVTVAQGTAANLNATVVGTGTFAVQAAQSGTWNIGTVTTLTSITNAVTVVGAAASGAAKSGNPVQGGAVFNTTQPTVTTGQVVENQATARGALIVATGVDGFSVSVTGTSAMNLTQVGGSAVALGSAVSASSIPVVIASNQAAFPVNIQSSGTTLTNTGGSLNVNITGGSSGNAAASATGAAVPASAGYTGLNIAGNLVGLTGLSLTNSKPATVAIVDGAGTQITSFGGSSQFAMGSAQSSTALGTISLGYDGTNVRGLAVNTSGQLQVVFPSAQAVTLTSTTVTGTVAVTQSGTWTNTVTQATGTNLHTVVDSGSITVTQGTAANLNATVTGTVAATQSGTWNVGTVTTITNPVTVVGDSASGATNAGNPVKIGGAFNTTQPTVTNGQTVDAQMTARGALIVATGLDGFQIANFPNTQLVSGTVASTQNGTWNVGITGSVAVTGTFFQATQPVSIASSVAVTGAFFQATQPVSGTITVGNFPTAFISNIGTTGGITVAQASTTSGQSGPLVQGAVTTTTPAYTTAQTNPLSLTTNGELRITVPDRTVVVNLTAVSQTAVILMEGRQGAAFELTSMGTGGVVIFEGSIDGVTWVQLNANNDVTDIWSGSTSTVGSFWLEPSGVMNAFRLRVTAITSGTITGTLLAGNANNLNSETASAAGSPAPPLISQVGGSDGTNLRPLAMAAKGTQGALGLSTQDLKDAGRTSITYFANAAASGATGTETAITLTRAAGTAATTTGSSFVVTSGKTFRITSITVATRGNATATAQITTFNMRVNTAGAVVTTSTPIVFSAASACAATASAWDRYQLPIPDGFEITGTGTLQFGMTANAVFTTNAPTWFVTITGFEY